MGYTHILPKTFVYKPSLNHHKYSFDYVSRLDFVLTSQGNPISWQYDKCYEAWSCLYRGQCVYWRVLFWCLCAELRSNEGNKQQNNTPPSAYTVRHDNTYIILFLTRHIKPTYDDKRRSSHIDSASQLLLLRFVDHVLIYCWWCHKAITWPDNCDASTWKVISDSLDIDFIHGGRVRRWIISHNMAVYDPSINPNTLRW